MAKASKTEREIMPPEEILMENNINEEQPSPEKIEEAIAPAADPLAPEHKDPEPATEAQKSAPPRIADKGGVEMIRIQSCTTGIWQYNKSTYALNVGGFFEVEKPLGDSLIARNEAVPA